MTFSEFYVYLKRCFILNADTNTAISITSEKKLSTTLSKIIEFCPNLDGTVFIKIRNAGQTVGVTFSVYKDNETSPIVSRTVSASANTISYTGNTDNLIVECGHTYKIYASCANIQNVYVSIASNLGFMDNLIVQETEVN